MGDWSEYFEDYPGGYFGEAPYTIPPDAERQAERRRRELTARNQAKHTAEIQELISTHTPPAIDAIRGSLEDAGDVRPETVRALGQWINEQFAKKLSSTTLGRLVDQLERDGFIKRDGDGIQYPELEASRPS